MTDRIDDVDVRVRRPPEHAAGLKAVAVSLSRSVRQMGVRRTAATWRQLNQVDGFDCMSCAWPDPAPGERHTAEFCENGAKAVAEEATTERVTASSSPRTTSTTSPDGTITGSASRAG